MEKDPKVAAQVKVILKLIKELSPGNTVELRIPGYGAIQCVAGGNHRRGTPPNTVEMSGPTLVKLILEDQPYLSHLLLLFLFALQFPLIVQQRCQQNLLGF